MVLFFRIEKIVQYLTLLSLLLFGGAVAGKDPFSLDPATLKKVEAKYGQPARQRLLAWEKLIRQDASSNDLEKLEKVNDFFNEMEFVDDRRHWQERDYWATPVEFLASGGGDCEDFALAKYFTLKAIGLEEKKLNMTYVKALRLNQAHMVVTYYSRPGAVPLVLDNLVTSIEPATNRKDLMPVYSFNGSGLWLAKARGRGEMIGKSDRLKRWQEILQRLPAGLD